MDGNKLQSSASGLPSGVTDDSTCASGLASSITDASEHIPMDVVQSTKSLGRTGGSDPASDGAAGTCQQHIGVGSGAPGLTKTQKRNLRRRLAKQTSQNTSGGSGAGSKRPRSDGSTPSPAVKIALKKPRIEAEAGSYALAAKSIKMAIVGENFPAVRLSEEDGNIIRRAILERTDLIPVGGHLPVILGNTLMKGAMIIHCGDAATVEWVKVSFDGIREVLGGVALKVLSASDLPKPVKVAFKTKDTFTKEPGVFLRRLNRLNPNLKSLEWRVLQVTAEQHSARWIFEVDLEDVEEIRRANFGALTGLDRGIFKILHDPNRKAESAATEEALATLDAVPSSASSVVSNLDLTDLTLDSGSENTLQPGSPRSLSELDNELKDLQESKPGSSPGKSQLG